MSLRDKSQLRQQNPAILDQKLPYIVKRWLTISPGLLRILWVSCHEREIRNEETNNLANIAWKLQNINLNAFQGFQKESKNWAGMLHQLLWHNNTPRRIPRNCSDPNEIKIMSVLRLSKGD